MSEAEISPINELEKLLNELEAVAPTQRKSEGTAVVFRSVADENVVEDSPPVGEELDLSEELTLSEESVEAEESETASVSGFQLSGGGPIAAVDCGIVRLGETENGLVIALRATLVIDEKGSSQVRMFRTGPMYLHNRYKLQMLHHMGLQLGKPDLFVEVDETDVDNPRPVRVKAGVADDAHQYGDRFRNWFERLVQRIAVTSIDRGTVLFDGALTLRTRHTPGQYLKSLADLASVNGNAIIAISKQSMLQIQGKSIRFWLNDSKNQPCYRWLTSLMKKEESDRVLGNVYAARFSSLGPTFRMDVKAAEGQTDDEAIGQFYDSSLMRGGYPDILVRAHTYSYFTSPDVIQLQAQAATKYALIPQSEINLTGIFAPFGGRFK